MDSMKALGRALKAVSSELADARDEIDNLSEALANTQRDVKFYMQECENRRQEYNDLAEEYKRKTQKLYLMQIRENTRQNKEYNRRANLAKTRKEVCK